MLIQFDPTTQLIKRDKSDTHKLLASIVFNSIHFFFCLLQDPLETIRAKCEETEHCVHLRERLELCETRVNSKSNTTEECTEELFDFLHARDHCVRVQRTNRDDTGFFLCLLMSLHSPFLHRYPTNCSTMWNDLPTVHLQLAVWST